MRRVGAFRYKNQTAPADFLLKICAKKALQGSLLRRDNTLRRKIFQKGRYMTAFAGECKLLLQGV